MSKREGSRAAEWKSSRTVAAALPLRRSTAVSRVEELRRQLGRWVRNDEIRMTGEECDADSSFPAGFSSGTSALDRLLPGGSLRHGMLVEWLGSRVTWGSLCETATRESRTESRRDSATWGAATLSLLSAREACRLGGILVVMDRRHMFYPPAAAAWGIDLERLIVVRPRNTREELWATVQALRSPVVAAVWGEIAAGQDSRALRRLQLAARAGRTLGLFLRPARAQGQPTWADVQLGVEQQGADPLRECPGREQGARGTQDNFGFRHPGGTWDCGFKKSNPPYLGSRLMISRYVHVQVLRMQGGRAGGSALLEIDDAARVVREVEKRLSAESYQLSAKPSG